MRRYETIIITDPDMAEDARKALTAKIGELMAAEGGHLIRQDDWGVRKLAYEIRKKPRGFYTLFDFCGQGALVDEMERQFRIDDRVLKYMTVVLDKEADLELIKAEIAAAEAETAATEAQTQAAATTQSAATDVTEEKAAQPEEAAAEPASEKEAQAKPAETESVEKE
jgi:small subunit ribosomal protein S6